MCGGDATVIALDPLAGPRSSAVAAARSMKPHSSRPLSTRRGQGIGHGYSGVSRGHRSCPAEP